METDNIDKDEITKLEKGGKKWNTAKKNGLKHLR